MAEPELQQLRIFAAVAEARSYRRAAQQLGLSPSAVSQAVRRLEAQLGLPLLLRSTRSVALSGAGQQLLAQVQAPLQQLTAAFAGLGEWRDEVGGSLRLSVPRSAARLLLSPIAARFLAAYPRVQLEICTQDAMVDIVEQGFDAGVRFSERLPRDMVAVPLGGAQRFIVVAAPGLLAGREPPTHPRELQQLRCVRQRFASGALFRWAFARAGEALEIEPQGPLTVDDQAMALAAALDGAGCAYVYEAAAQGDLASGRLVQLLGDWCPPGSGFALYYPGRRQASPALRAFISMLPSARPDAPGRPAARPD